MSPVKQIVKASITSLWWSRAEFVPTAGISCTLSWEQDRPSSPRGAPLAPWGWGGPMGSGETPCGKTDLFLVSTLLPPQDSLLCLQTCPMGSSGMENASPKRTVHPQAPSSK